MVLVEAVLSPAVSSAGEQVYLALSDRFYLIATDLRIHGNWDWDRAQRHGSKSIVVWESRDLVRWSAPRLVRVSPDTAGNRWAPEAFYDPRLSWYG